MAKATRIGAKKASRQMGISLRSLDRLVDDGALTVIRNSRRGYRFFLPDEIEAYRTGGVVACRDLRLKTGRLKSRKR